MEASWRSEPYSIGWDFSERLWFNIFTLSLTDLLVIQLITLFVLSMWVDGQNIFIKPGFVKDFFQCR